jgi:hypothetical protein
MRIFIDSTWHIIYLFENGKQGDQLFSGRELADITFQSIVDSILTTSQQEKYCTGNDISYQLSKKKQAVLNSIIEKQKWNERAEKFGKRKPF